MNPFNNEEEPRGNVLIEAGSGLAVPLTMQRMDLAGRVTPAGAMLRVTHQFKTESDGPIEAIYTFMLPRNGTLRRFIVKGEDFEVESKLEVRKEARAKYEEGVEAGHLSVLAEANPDGMVSLSVGQVQPDELITVVMDIISGVELKDNTYRFRFPFTLAPSYHARATTSSTGKMQLPTDVFGDLILPEWKDDASGLHQVSFTMNVEAAGKLDCVSSPSHRIQVRPNGEGSVEIKLSSAGDIPNRDLVIDVQAKEVEASVFADTKLVSKKTSKDDPKIPKDAPRWAALVPSSLIPKMKTTPRRVCFVLDDSGSMSGAPIKQGRLALRACLSALRPTDEFGLMYFGSNYTKFDDNMAKATDANRKRADKFIDPIGASSGGTELAAALGAAISILDGSGGDIFLMTDGQVFESSTIIEQCAAAGTRVHVLGIGSASQDRFLASLARRTNGQQGMVGVTEDITSKALGLFNAVRQPVQTNLKAYVVTGKKMAQEHEVDVIWDGYPILLTDDGTTGLNAPTAISFTWGKGKQAKKVKVPMNYIQEVPNGLSCLLYAGRQVEDLENAIDAALKDSPARKNSEIMLKAVSTTYGLASQVMSLIAVVKRAGDQAGQQPEQRVVAVGTPEGMANRQNSRGMLRGMLVDSCSVMLVDSCSVSGGSSTRYGSSPSVNYCAQTLGFMDGEPERSTQPLGFRTRTKSSSLSSSITKDLENLNDSITAYSADEDYGLVCYIVKLQSDGGLPGLTRKKRAHETAILALAAHMEDQGSDSPSYSLHIERMLEFLNHYLDLNAGKDPNMALLVGIIEAGQTALNEDCRQILCNSPMSGDSEINWAHLSGALSSL